MELDELKTSWKDMHDTLRVQNLHLKEWVSRQRASEVQLALRPLQHWQIFQVVVGVILAAIGGQFWVPRMEDPLLLTCGLVVHAYGVALIIYGLNVLLRFGEINFSAPLIELQNRIARLERSYVMSGWALGLPWWLLWIPMAVVGLTLGGIELGRTNPAGWVTANVIVGIVGMLLTVGAYRWALRSADENVRRRVLRITRGEYLDRANRLLEELDSFKES
ncbi:MAG: hypothetical protein AAFX85_17385 [Pseudomonadota bacterium]